VKCLKPSSKEFLKNRKSENQSRKKAKPNPNLNETNAKKSKKKAKPNPNLN
jgi:hypothetical protein